RSGEPTWVGEARWLQVSVTGAAFDDVQVDLIDSMGLSRSVLGRAGDAIRSAWRGGTTGDVAQAKGEPAVVTRSQWGADESLRSGRPSYARQASYAVLHHTVNTNDYTRAQAAGIVRGIYAYHTQSRGWSDIGYNVLVDRFGTIYEGRAGGLTRAVIGAHTLGFNTGSIGVAMIGNYDTGSVTSATRSAVAHLLAWKFAIHGIDPKGTVDITSACTGTCKHPRGSVVTMPTLFGHRDVGQTSCPGANGYAALPGIRTAIRAQEIDIFANAVVSPDTVGATADALASPVSFSVDVIPAGDWAFVVKYDDGTVVHQQSGTGGRAEVTWKGGANLRTGRYWYKFTGGQRTPAIGTFSVERLAYDPPFSDDDTSVHADNIATLYERGVTLGCTATTFCPTHTVQRAQMASFLHRTMDNLIVPTPTPTRDWFADDNRSVHQDAINSLAEGRIVSGCTEGAFCPTRNAIRGDVAIWLASAFDLQPRGTDHFTDDDGTSYEAAINALADAGLTQGCTATTYCPDESTSRGQMASFLARAIDTLESSGLAG
ncbi:MAG: N-acetylmuramoyl-L-alanine amidase, partial [Actinobacteria bacterium]|nr:N-acetylmuramoyl-L-alanine amidase [Actinomycetota bacterium]